MCGLKKKIFVSKPKSHDWGNRRLRSNEVILKFGTAHPLHLKYCYFKNPENVGRYRYLIPDTYSSDTLLNSWIHITFYVQKTRVWVIFILSYVEIFCKFSKRMF